MKKICTNLNIITFALFSLCAPITCLGKNWLQTKIDNFTNTIVSRKTYTHGSFEHVRDMAILFTLPAHIGQNVLWQQRNNMKNFLEENEKNTLEEIRQHLNLDQETWSKTMNKAKEEQEFNLIEMKKDQNFNTYHDPLLPNSIIEAVHNASQKLNINPNSLNLKRRKKYPSTS